ncbi:hypothetical protein FRB95_004325, partial [Tulasnella sp. JGI-2019a]
MTFQKKTALSTVFITLHALHARASYQREEPHPWRPIRIRQQAAELNGMTMANTPMTDAFIPTTQTYTTASTSLTPTGMLTSTSTSTAINLFSSSVMPTRSVFLPSTSPSSETQTTPNTADGNPQIIKFNRPVVAGIAIITIFVILNVGFLMHRWGLCSRKRCRTSKRFISKPMNLDVDDKHYHHDANGGSGWYTAKKEADLSSASMDFHDGPLSRAMASKVSWMGAPARYVRSESRETLSRKQSDIGEGDARDISWEMKESPSKDSAHNHKAVEEDYYSYRVPGV